MEFQVRFWLDSGENLASFWLGSGEVLVGFCCGSGGVLLGFWWGTRRFHGDSGGYSGGNIKALRASPQKLCFEFPWNPHPDKTLESYRKMVEILM